jgi:hypothetical protein
MLPQPDVQLPKIQDFLSLPNSASTLALAEKDLTSLQLDEEAMEEETTSQGLLEQLELWEELSDEQHEELELMEINAYNAAEGEEADNMLGNQETEDKQQDHSNRTNQFP